MRRAAASRILGHALALGATLIWSSLYIDARVLADRYSPADLTFCRWLLAFGLLAPFVWPGLVRHRRILLAHLPFLAAASLCGMIGFSLAIFMAGKTATAADMSLLIMVSPVIIALICRFALHERLSRPQIAGLLIAVSGVGVVISGGGADLPASLIPGGGSGWTFGAAASFAVYSVLVRCKPPDLPASMLLAATMGLGMLLSLPPFALQWLQPKSLPIPTRDEILCLLHLGPGASLLAYLCWNKAILLIGPIRAGMVYYCLPFFSCALAVIFLNERLSWLQAAGGLLIVGGITLSAVAKNTGRAPPPQNLPAGRP
jgi:drug/metabolite transporter (DMT)-like permease